MNMKSFIFYRALRKIYRILFCNKGKQLGTIYMLHRVDVQNNNKLFSNENMKVSPEVLQKFINFLKSKNVDFIAFKDLPDYLAMSRKKNFVVFTLDDGYKDNFTNAYPVFKKSNVPFTIFLASDFPDKKAILWWYVLEDLILTNESLTLSNGITYFCKNKEEKEKAFLDIRLEILALDQTNLEFELNKLFCNYSINWYDYSDSLTMDWSEIEKLNHDSIVTIGAHTQHHYNLKRLPDEKAVENEIYAGLKQMHEHGVETDVFAYPFGSPNECGEREFDILSKSEFKVSCCATGGACFNKDRKNLFSLPRLFLTEDYINNILDNSK